MGKGGQAGIALDGLKHFLLGHTESRPRLPGTRATVEAILKKSFVRVVIFFPT